MAWLSAVHPSIYLPGKLLGRVLGKCPRYRHKPAGVFYVQVIDNLGQNVRLQKTKMEMTAGNNYSA